MCAFVSPKLDQTSAYKIIEEAIKREERCHKLATEFTIHNHKKRELQLGSKGALSHSL